MSWALMAAVGVGSMAASGRTHPTVDIILVRVAGFAFMAVGLIGVTGWLGNALAAVVGWVTGAADTIGAAALGTAIVWIISAGLGLLWIAAMLPDQLFRFDAPDWLVVAGIFIPGLLAAVPGALGQVLRTITTWAGQGITSVVSGAVS